MTKILHSNTARNKAGVGPPARQDMPAAERVQGPRIYNLFPALAGPLHEWQGHLPRIAAMNFDWVYINPFHVTGASGSLYAIKDPFSVGPPFLGALAPEQGPAALRRFTASAQHAGLKVMMDLVINHTAHDALLAQEHPEWYRREPDGSLRLARAIDPVDPTKVTIWEDLAELDFDSPQARAALTEYWIGYVRSYARLGFTGFRCDAAYQVPEEVWRRIIAPVKQAMPGVQFFGETLGCTTDQVAALADAGFDYIFNSAKWWDFKSDWLLDQYELFRLIAPSIAFPESHDTERLAAEGSDVPAIAARLRFHLMFAACFSSGLLMPMGYEFGFRRKLDVVKTRPRDWERTNIDLSDFIAVMLAMKAKVPALNVEGQQRRLTPPDSPVVALLRLEGGHPVDAATCALTLLNPDELRSHEIALGPLLTGAGGLFDRFVDITPQAAPMDFAAGRSLLLEPLGFRVFRGERAAITSKAQQAAPIHATGPHDALSELAANRLAIERIHPEIDGGRFPVKRVVGDILEVSADIFTDGHDKVQARVKYRAIDEDSWSEAAMDFIDNDRWMGRVPLTRNIDYLYTIEAWRDLFGTWRADLIKRRAAKQDLRVELDEGLTLVEKAAARAKERYRDTLVALQVHAKTLRNRPDDLADLLLAEEIHAAMVLCADRTNLSRYGRELTVIVDRQAAVFSAWYELMPRSQSGDVTRHGTFEDVIARLPYVRAMGFDVLYFPPIHPIGHTNRKGRNNSLSAAPNDPGSPYAIGAEAGGHTAIHPELGTLADFQRLVQVAHAHGLEIALDFAIQCSPDHPWIKEHPEWFDWRPDGTIKFAENPPKRYEDIVNLHFYRDAYPAVWHALRDAVLFWIKQGVKIFRVDNPHTKPLPFWEWMIGEVRRQHPDVVFLAEAFTRPKMMKRLAKLGFTQSYTYFTWRTGKRELTEYLTELTQEEPREHYRPNFFANTPDINPHHLQTGGRAAFIARATLAATLSGDYGIYSGFELCEAAFIPGKEEYLNSEKYELRAWDWNRSGHIRDHITRLNHIRRHNPALHGMRGLRFYNAFNEHILLYGRMTDGLDNFLLIAVNLDPHHIQSGNFEVPLWEFGLPDQAGVEAEDLLRDRRIHFHGKVQHLHLDPQVNPCEIWRLRQPEEKA